MEKQFASMQERMNMNAFTLQFSKTFEQGYAKHTQETSVYRVRCCFLVGFFAIAAFLVYEVRSGLFELSERVSSSDLHTLYILSFAVGLPTFAIGFLLTFSSKLKHQLERITFYAFFIVALTFILKKPFQKQKGPVLPLIILMIPIFGTTGMRFVRSCILGWSICFLYLGIQLWSLKFYTGGWYDTQWEIICQTMNYGICVIGGMTPHYYQVNHISAIQLQ